ncbi:MAG: hypothetical protein AAF591_18990 [Verrucomicrobiota bacterium]
MKNNRIGELAKSPQFRWRLQDDQELGHESGRSYLVEMGLSPAQPLKIWECELDELISHQDSTTIEYALPLRLVWEKSIAQCAPESTALLRMLSLLAPGEALELKYLEKATNHLFPLLEAEGHETPLRIKKLVNDLSFFH